jgi:hypothetical protein
MGAAAAEQEMTIGLNGGLQTDTISVRMRTFGVRQWWHLLVEKPQDVG